MGSERVWVVYVTHADRSSWVDSVYQTCSEATDRVAELEEESTWVDAYAVGRDIKKWEKK